MVSVFVENIISTFVVIGGGGGEKKEEEGGRENYAMWQDVEEIATNCNLDEAATN